MIRSTKLNYNLDKAYELLYLVSSITGINEADILSHDRKASFVLSRQIISHYLRYRYNYKLQQIGRFFNTHHTTILNSLSKVANMIDINDSLTVSIMAELDNLISINEKLTIPKYLTIQLNSSHDSILIAKMIEQQYNCTVLIN
jgi:chromosomal replication initiation ATPase DnaA